MPPLRHGLAATAHASRVQPPCCYVSRLRLRRSMEGNAASRHVDATPDAAARCRTTHSSLKHVDPSSRAQREIGKEAAVDRQAQRKRLLYGMKARCALRSCWRADKRVAGALCCCICGARVAAAARALLRAKDMREGASAPADSIGLLFRDTPRGVNCIKQRAMAAKAQVACIKAAQRVTYVRERC